MVTPIAFGAVNSLRFGKIQIHKAEFDPRSRTSTLEVSLAPDDSKGENPYAGLRPTFYSLASQTPRQVTAESNDTDGYTPRFSITLCTDPETPRVYAQRNHRGQPNELLSAFVELQSLRPLMETIGMLFGLPKSQHVERSEALNSKQPEDLFEVQSEGAFIGKPELLQVHTHFQTALDTLATVVKKQTGPDGRVDRLFDV